MGKHRSIVPLSKNCNNTGLAWVTREWETRLIVNSECLAWRLQQPREYLTMNTPMFLPAFTLKQHYCFKVTKHRHLILAARLKHHPQEVI